MFSRYWAAPSDEESSNNPAFAQKLCHQVVVVEYGAPPVERESALKIVCAVVSALPPVQWGAATMTRNEPSAFGVKLTRTSVELTTEAATFWAPAVIAAIEPKVPAVPIGAGTSDQVSARVPIAPDAAALGARPLHKC